MKAQPTSQQQEFKRFEAEKTKWARRKARWTKYKNEIKQGNQTNAK
jgi:hypothetical protein